MAVDKPQQPFEKFAVSISKTNWNPALVSMLRRVAIRPEIKATELVVQVQQGAVIEGLKKMFDDRHFSICAYETLYETLHGIEIPRAIRKRITCYHCVNWADMESEIRDTFQEYLIRVLKDGPQ